MRPIVAVKTWQLIRLVDFSEKLISAQAALAEQVINLNLAKSRGLLCVLCAFARVIYFVFYLQHLKAA